MFGLQHTESGQRRPHRQTVFAECRSMNNGPAQRAIDRVINRFSHQYCAYWHQTTAHGLRQDHDIWSHAKVLRRQKWPGAVHPSLYFVEYQERTIAAAESLCCAEIPRRRHPNAGFGLNRLDEERSECLGGQLLFESVGVIECNRFGVRKEWTESITPE